MNVETILITGGSGMIGTALARHLTAQGYKAIILTRNAGKAKEKSQLDTATSFANWDIDKQTIDAEAFAKADAIVHLAGAGVVDKPWTQAYKEQIVKSRVLSSALIVKALTELPNKVKTVLSVSAIGWYGPDKGGRPFIETDNPVRTFLGETCRLWEESIKPVIGLQKRLVICRLGIVLSKKGGALAEFKKPLKLRVAAVLGNGRQVISWIHIADLCSIFQFALQHKEMEGVYNAVAPQPVTNKELTLALAKAMYGNAFITVNVPAFALKTILGERSIEVLKSATVSAAKLEVAGFTFKYPSINEATQELATK